MTKFVVMLLFVSINLFADDSWKKQVQILLPSPLEKLQPHKTTLKDIEKLLGKAHLVEDQNYYWEQGGLKYALKIRINNKKVLTSFHYTFTGIKPEIKQILRQIPLEKFKPYPASGSAAGRYLIYKDKNAELIVDPVTKTIHSVQFP